jgi:hypothetical protein
LNFGNPTDPLNDMTQASTPVLTPSSPNGSVVFAPGEKFFVRRVPLAPDGDVSAQVELALEGFSPFPASQLYYGFRTNPTRTQALVFAAFRKNFSAEETATWTGASAVLPTFSVWLGAATVPLAGVSLRENGDEFEAVSWDGRSELPAAVVVRTQEASERDELVAEARQKADLSADAALKTFRPAVEITRENRELILKLATGGIEARFDEAGLGHADIRDKELLKERRITLRRDTLLWRGFAAVVIGLAVCMVLELGLFGARFWLSGRKAEVDAQAPLAAKIEQTQGVAKKLEEISTQRLLPFEMINVLNNKRPSGMDFSSVTTKGLWQLDIRGQANSADDTSTFESEVRKIPAIQQLEVMEKNTRDRVTVFRYEITFKPNWSQLGGAK